MSRVKTLLIAVILVVGILFPTTTLASPEATVSITDATLPPGASGSVVLSISTTEPVSCIDVDITYDPEVVEVTEVTDASGSDFDGLESNIQDNHTHLVAWVASPTGLTGTIKVADITLTRLGGESELALDVITLKGDANNPIPFTVDNGWVTADGTPPADDTAPTVVSTSPANGATGVAITTTVGATFSEAIDEGTLSFSLDGVAGSVSYSGTTATFTPSANLGYRTSYTASISASDLAGNPMVAPYSCTFTTGTVPTVPPAVTTDPATGVTTTLATLNVSLTDLGTATSVSVSFEWGETSAYGNETTTQTMTSTGAFSFSLSGLSSNTTYHFRAKAVGDGTSYGIDRAFTTGTVPTVPPAVTTDPATGVTTTTLATLNGSLTDLGTATSVSVSFEWGETSAYGNETTPQTMTSTGAFSSSLSGLSSNTTYHFRAKAVGDGTGYGLNRSFTTGVKKVVTIPPGQTDYVVDASDIADTTITVDTTAEVTIAVTKYYSNPHPGATPPADTEMLPRYIDIDVDNPLAIDWPMSVEQSYSDDEVAGLDESSLGMCYFTADPLPDGAWHRCSDTGVYEDINTVWANIWKGELPGSPIAIGGIAAPEPEPVAPSLVTNAATSVTTSSATLNGNLGSLGTALSVEVSFEWGTTTAYGNETTPQTMTSTGAFSSSLSGLSSGTTYHFRARAVGDGTSYGIDSIFTTRARGGGGIAPSPAAPPAPPPGTTDVRGQVSDAGVFLESVTATSEDELCTLTIPEGTVGLTEELEPLTEISTLLMDEPPPPPEATHVIALAYDLGPDGATFDPPITLTLSYDPDDIPEGIAEEDLAIAYYDQATGEWVELEDCVVDTENNTVTASVSHFTTFVIIGVVTPPPEEEEVVVPAPAAFSVSNLAVTPLEVEPKEAVTITVSVANTGGTEGSYRVVLKVNGVKEAEKTATIAAESSLDVSFRITKEDAGSYSVTVDGLSASFTVVAPPEEEEEVPEVPAPINWPLIGGIIAAVIVIGLLAFFLVRRRAQVTRQ